MSIYDESENTWIDHRKTEEYYRRKDLLKTVWIASGILFLLIPIGIGVTGFVFMAFLSLSYLDETPYKAEQHRNI